MEASPLILRIVAASVTISNNAGSIIRDILSKGNLGVVVKGKNDFQTQADRSAQKYIVNSLEKLFPKITVIGEEEHQDGEMPSDWAISEEQSDQSILKLTCPPGLQNSQPEEVVVWVDPLDGTSEFTEGLLDHVTVLIGVAVGNEAVAGVIHQPYFNYKKENEPLGRTIWGIVGGGSGGFQPKSAPEKRIIATTRAHSNAAVENTLKAMEADEIMRVGGAGHKVLLLMEGVASAYVFASPGCKKWDTCAPEAVLKAIGGQLTDLEGNSYKYNSTVEHPNGKGVLGTAPGVSPAWYVERIPKEVLESLSKPRSAK